MRVGGGLADRLLDAGGGSGGAPQASAEVDLDHFLAARWLSVYRALGRVAAHVSLHRSDLLSKLVQDQIHRRSGFAAFSDFVREVLQASPRTIRRQLSLARVTAEAPLLRDAFLDGRLTVCKVLALQPVSSAESLPFWIELAETLTVRELAVRVRESLTRSAQESDAAHTEAQAVDADARDEQGLDLQQGPNALDLQQGPNALATRIAFSAPISAAIVWEEGVRVARRTLGWKAPQHLCVESILAEAEDAIDAEAALAQEGLQGRFSADGSLEWPLDDSGDRAGRRPLGSWACGLAPQRREPAPQRREPAPSEAPPGSRSTRPPTRPRPLSLEDAHAIRQTLAIAEREIHSLSKRISSSKRTSSAGSPGVPTPGFLEEPLRQYRALDQLDRRIRLLRAALVREVWTHHLHRVLGCSTLAQFAELHLGLSERAARVLVSEAYLFDDEPRLTRPFRDGRIGLTQAQLIRRVALPSTLEGYLLRAQAVTLRQFEREVHFLERLADWAPEIWGDHRRALPDPGLETALLEGIAERGGDPRVVLEDLRRRGLGDGTLSGAVPAHGPSGREGNADNVMTTGGEKHFADTSHGLPVDLSYDPAVHPRLMTRLEILLDIFVLQGYPQAPHGEQVENEGGLLESDSGLGPDPVTDPATDRQTLATHTAISFLAPPDLLVTWNDALHRLREARGPLPTWACAVLLVQHALDEWLRHDPDTVPTEHALLERDDYLCQAPGCSSRRHLEVHHIHFRSQGGTDHTWNKTTLCHTHHHHVLHSGYLRLTGSAPDGLVWELGTEPGHPPIRTLRGDRIVGSATVFRNFPDDRQVDQFET